jgi:ABC-2 type transport system ATP-binding protein
VAQHNIQKFLRYYQEERRVTILLTSHYMKDVAALCRRVVVITDGSIKYDGSLTGIIDSFSGSKILRLELAQGQSPEGLERFAEVQQLELPRVILRCPRADVPRMLEHILQNYQVEDVGVEDPPLEEVIANLFEQSSAAPTVDASTSSR